MTDIHMGDHHDRNENGQDAPRIAGGFGHDLPTGVGRWPRKAAGGRDDPWGLAAGAASYLIWGSFPLLFAAVAFAGPVEIIGHRVIWSAAFCLVVLAVSGRLRGLAGVLRDRRRLASTGLCALLLAVNWGAHVTSILAGQVVDAGIGYLVNPLLSVMLGAFVLGESLNHIEWAGIVIVAGSIAVVGFGYGRLSWAVVVLPVSWSLYGLVKKLTHTDGEALTGFTTEMILLVPLAAAALTWVEVTGASTFVSSGPGGSALLVVTGIATAVPLLLFNRAAARTRLSSLGMLQYISAGLQTVLGMTYFAEPMPPARMACLGAVLIGIVVFLKGRTQRQRGGRHARENSKNQQSTRNNKEGNAMSSLTDTRHQRGAV